MWGINAMSLTRHPPLWLGDTLICLLCPVAGSPQEVAAIRRVRLDMGRTICEPCHVPMHPSEARGKHSTHAAEELSGRRHTWRHRYSYCTHVGHCWVPHIIPIVWLILKFRIDNLVKYSQYGIPLCVCVCVQPWVAQSHQILEVPLSRKQQY